jgi:hypothetical protein
MTFENKVEYILSGDMVILNKPSVQKLLITYGYVLYECEDSRYGYFTKIINGNHFYWKIQIYLKKISVLCFHDTKIKEYNEGLSKVFYYDYLSEEEFLNALTAVYRYIFFMSEPGIKSTLKSDREVEWLITTNC